MAQPDPPAEDVFQPGGLLRLDLLTDPAAKLAGVPGGVVSLAVSEAGVTTSMVGDACELWPRSSCALTEKRYCDAGRMLTEIVVVVTLPRLTTHSTSLNFW